ncbi:hypothetical protein [Kocuria sp. KH4]
MNPPPTASVGIAAALTMLLAGLHPAAPHSHRLRVVLTDHGRGEHARHRFRILGRTLLAASRVAGWVLTSISTPGSVLPAVPLTALLNAVTEVHHTNRFSGVGRFSIGLMLHPARLAVSTAPGRWAVGDRGPWR